VIAEVQHTEHHLINDIHRVTCSGLAMTALVKSKAAGTIVRLELLSFFFLSYLLFLHSQAGQLSDCIHDIRSTVAAVDYSGSLGFVVEAFSLGHAFCLELF
jgi:hypothetical protein